MEAPDKIYIEVTPNGTSYYRDVVKEQRTKNSDIEYIRTDVSIKKALRWMISQGGVDDALSRQMIEDFKNYMKGE